MGILPLLEALKATCLAGALFTKGGEEIEYGLCS